MRLRTKIILSVTAVIILFVAYSAWTIYQHVMGDEPMPGTQSPIPNAQSDLPPLTTGAADWPRWRGESLDGKSAMTGIRFDWTDGLKKVWEIDFLCQGNTSATWSAPVISGNRLIVPGRSDTDDILFCLNPGDGRLIWTGRYPAPPVSGHGTGARATPSIDGDRVYAFGRGGDLSCWALFDGKLLWRKNVNELGGETPGWGHSSSPFVYGDLVLVQSGGSAETMAFNKMTGEIAWTSKPGVAGYSAFTPIPFDGKLALLAFVASGLTLLNPDNGKELAFTAWKTSYDVNATTPAVEGDIAFITSGYGTGGSAIQVNKDVGMKTLWTNKAIASQHSDPIIIDGYIYGYSGDSSQNKGDFVCMELKTGTEKWRTKEIGWGTALFVDGHILSMDIKGNLYLVKPDPSHFNKIAEMKNALGVVRSPAWTIPVVANGKLYVRYLQRLICYELAKN